MSKKTNSDSFKNQEVMEFEVFDVRQLEVKTERLDYVWRNREEASEMEIVKVLDGERGLLKINGRVERFLAPGIQISFKRRKKFTLFSFSFHQDNYNLKRLPTIFLSAHKFLSLPDPILYRSLKPLPVRPCSSLIPIIKSSKKKKIHMYTKLQIADCKKMPEGRHKDALGSLEVQTVEKLWRLPRL